MPRFNLALATLYDLAERATHDDFPVDALKLLQPWIDFDGAILWCAEVDGGIVRALLAAHGYIHRRSCGGKHAAGEAHVLAMTPAIQALLSDMEKPVLRDCQQQPLPGPGGGHSEWRHLMLFGENSLPHNRGRWILLYRSRNVPFTPLQAEYLYAAWLHLMRSLDINLSRALDRHDPERPQRASAMINEQGYVIAADPQFHRLLQHEWSDYQRKRLPQPALNCLAHDRFVYRGRQIIITITRQSGYLTCLARVDPTLAGLTPSEYMVAQCFANGQTHKAIARETGRSPNTVRNQIARLYDKLGINNKAALAQHFAQHGSHRKSNDPEH